MAMSEGSTLYDLALMGIRHTHAAVGVVVRLRKELSLVKDIPVLIAVDQVRHFLVTSCNDIFSSFDNFVFESIITLLCNLL